MIEKIKELREKRVPIKEICKILNISYEKLYKEINKHGLKKYYSNQDPSLMAKSREIADKYSTGQSISSLGREYGCSSDPIKKMIKAENVYKRSFDEQTQLGKKYKFNERYFECIDSDSKAYVLGLLMADGYVAKYDNCIRLSLQVGDIDMTNFFVSELESNKPVKIIYPKGHNPISFASVISKKTVEDLYKWGCVQCKSLILKFPSNIDEKFMPSLIRGYFDGDGCAHLCVEKTGYTRLSLFTTSSIHFINGLNNYLSTKGIVTQCKPHQFSKQTHISTIRDTVSCWKFFKLIYHANESFSLRRKKEKFIEFFRDKKRVLSSNQAAKNNLIKKLTFLFEKNGESLLIESENLRAFCKERNLTLSKVYEMSKRNKLVKKWKITRMESPNIDGIQFLDWLMNEDLDSL